MATVDGSDADNDGTDAPEYDNVWEFVEKVEEDERAVGWRCPNCCKDFKGVSATKALAHCARMKGFSVAICFGSVPAAELDAYKKLWFKKREV